MNKLPSVAFIHPILTHQVAAVINLNFCTRRDIQLEGSEENRVLFGDQNVVGCEHGGLYLETENDNHFERMSASVVVFIDEVFRQSYFRSGGRLHRETCGLGRQKEPVFWINAPRVRLEEHHLDFGQPELPDTIDIEIVGGDSERASMYWVANELGANECEQQQGQAPPLHLNNINQ